MQGSVIQVMNVDRERRRVQLTVKKSLLRSTHPKLLRYGTHRRVRYYLLTLAADAQQPATCALNNDLV